MAAFLGQVGGREIDGDPARRQRQAGRDQGGAHALARFGYRLVGKPHHVEGGQSGRDLDLDIDGARLDAFKRDRRDPLDHDRPCLGQRLAQPTIGIKNI